MCFLQHHSGAVFFTLFYTKIIKTNTEQNRNFTSLLRFTTSHLFAYICIINLKLYKYVSQHK